MFFLSGQLEPRLLVDGSGGFQFALRPQDHFFVTYLAGKANAFLDQATANAETARGGFDDEQTEFRNSRGFADEKDGADALSVALGDPTALLFGIEIADEFGDDFGDKSFETFVIAILLRIENAVAENDPTHVARLMGAEKVRVVRGGCGREGLFNLVHGGHEFQLISGRNLGEHLLDLLIGTFLERTKHGETFGGEGEMRLAAVGGGGFAMNPPALLELGKDTAEVTGIETEIGGKIGSGHAVMVRHFVKETGLGEGERTIEQSLLQEANLARVEAVEAADDGNEIRIAGTGAGMSGHGIALELHDRPH